MEKHQIKHNTSPTCLEPSISSLINLGRKEKNNGAVLLMKTENLGLQQNTITICGKIYSTLPKVKINSVKMQRIRSFLPNNN